jgi:hypothetical protein
LLGFPLLGLVSVSTILGFIIIWAAAGFWLTMSPGFGFRRALGWLSLYAIIYWLRTSSIGSEGILMILLALGCAFYAMVPPGGGIGQITPNKPAMLVSVILALFWIALAGTLPVPSDDLLNLLVMVALGVSFLAKIREKVGGSEEVQ